MVTEDIKLILKNLIKSGILPKTMSTRKVVEYLNSKEYHRAKLYLPEFKELLGRRRIGADKNFEFDTLKVIEFEMELQGTISFPVN
ncbi:MAG: hypothetical protein E2O83_01350 [Bacteroidetes bacterium]|nr:MAG: hypothetical protein E2O83_01350 [Bacteroidota bacterium]